MQPQLDISLARSFVYPSNYPPRQYQVEICKSAIDRNTLVVLPTGWFPTGKVVFLAPTKPLVLQQTKACLNIMGIPENQTAQMEGSTNKDKRTKMWESNRVFFCTPQTFEHDLNGSVDPKKIVLVVFDEAHKAQGSYAYVQIMNILAKKNSNFRVLALSATPGSDIKKVQQVISNLHISNLEIRSEDDPELKNYTHHKEIEYVTCEEGVASVEVLVKKELTGIMREVSNKISSVNILNRSVDTYSKMILEEASRDLERLYNNNGVSPEIFRIYKGHLEELLLLEELRKDAGNPDIVRRLEELQSRISTMSPSMKALVQSNKFKRVLALAKKSRHDNANLQLRQPKVAKLKTILEVHFDKSHREGKSTRVIVFCTLRTTVHDIVIELNTLAGIRSHAFIGQSTKTTDSEYDSSVIVDKGLNQAEQSKVLSDFNNDVYNVLVATSIAEEGLDIAEVDLIILFDTVLSPVRQVQRMGRTGRKRDGRIIMLLFENEKSKIEKSSDSLTVVTKVLQNRLKIKFCPELSMLPRMPEMSLQNIVVGEVHLSQIDGVSLGNNAKKSNQTKKVTVNNQQTLTQMMNDPIYDMGNRFPARVDVDIPVSPIDIEYEEEILERLALQAASCSFSKSSSASEALAKVSSLPPSSLKKSLQSPQLTQNLLLSQQHIHSNFYDNNDHDQNYDIDNYYDNQHYPDNNISSPTPNTSKFDQIFFSNQYKQLELKLKSFSDMIDKENMVMMMIDNTHGLNCPIHTNSHDNVLPKQLLNQGILKKLKSPRQALHPLLPSLAINNTEVISQSEVSLNNIKFINVTNNGSKRKFAVPDDSDNESNDNTCTNNEVVSSLKNPLNSKFKVPDQSSSDDDDDNDDDDSKSVEIDIKNSIPVAVQLSSTGILKKETSPTFVSMNRKFMVPESSSDDDDDDDHHNEETCMEDVIDYAEETCLEETCMETFDYMDNGKAKDIIQLNFAKISCSPNPNIDINVKANIVKETPPLNGSMDKSIESVNDHESPQYFFTNGTYCDDSAYNYINAYPDKTKDFNFLSRKSFENGNTMKAPNPKVPTIKMQSSAMKPVRSSTRHDIDRRKSSWRSDKTNSNKKSESTRKRETTMGTLTLISNPKRKTPVVKSEHHDNGDEIDKLRCQFCFSLESYEEDPILICDGCNQCTHMTCYNLRTIPTGDFYCEGCSVSRQVQTSSTTLISSLPKKTTCALCLRKGGIMKKSSCGSFVHLLCQTFTPELAWGDDLRSDLRKVNKDRKALTCEVCHKENVGACIQCSDKVCVAASHPYCAYHGNWQMITRYNSGEDILIREIFCSEHEHLVGYQNDIVDSKKVVVFKDLDMSIRDTPASDFKRKPDLKRLKKLRKLNHEIKTLNNNKRHDKSDLKYAKQAREKYFEDEADVSGSASDDERGDMSQELSGDFINDGEYTDDDDAGVYTQHAMYYRLNHLEGDSPVINFRGAEKGLPIIERLIKKQKFEIPESPMDESFVSYENDSVFDSNQETSPNVYSICSDDVTSAKKIGLDDGSKKSTVSRVRKFPLTSSTPENGMNVQSENIRVINQSLPYSRQPLSNVHNLERVPIQQVTKTLKIKAPLESQDSIVDSSSIKPLNTTTIKVNNFAHSYDLNSINDDDEW